MHLKKLAVSGFKSFADKVEVEFDQGVTGIIGPNGCGKSNVSDAIRWVLGEHNPRRLRGTAMMDMIFNGTVSRAAEGMAEVTLVFDNADNQLPISYREVQISRRLYRSGESEYLINKTKCRMKDITDLFLDSGIGTSSYSLMEQGRVDMIVNAKPTERRIILEEAAGVSRFLHRKNEALRKLDRTEQDIT
ncbi:AAA family ATPase, partial [bacterium]|nr:AAA family ATPase [bacterium]